MSKGNWKYNKEKLDKAWKYYEKADFPFIEELAKNLGVTGTTIVDWSNKHKEFKEIYDLIVQSQKLALLKASLGKKFNVSGAIFQLKANHGMIETEKQLHEHSGNLTIQPILYSKPPDKTIDASESKKEIL